MALFYITGTSSGIGLALAKRLCANSHNRVIGLSRRQTYDANKFEHIGIDLSTEEATNGFAFDAPCEENELVVLVNNAGYLGEVKPVGQASSASLAKAIGVNLTAPIILSNNFLNTYQNHAGSVLIINISSGAANSSIDGWATYCATKAGLDRFSLTLQQEASVHSANYKCFSIAPGVVDTEMQEQIRESNKEDFSMIQRFLDLHENRELTSPEEVAEKLEYIAFHSKDIQEVVFSLRDFTLPL